MARSRGSKGGVAVRSVLEALETIAPLALAEPWDNVGLLVGAEDRPATARKVALAVDLTEAVLAETIAAGAELVVAYHPPIFEPLKRVTTSDRAGRIVHAAIEAGIAIYSPHTALDCAPGGVNDWLADGLPEGHRRAVARPNARVAVGEGAGSLLIGQGRFVVLDDAAPLASLVARMKRHLGLKSLRLAAHPRHERESISTVAVCAGSGAEVLLGSGADLLVTGEMSHHKVLAANAAGSSVLLAEHSHTERGFLPRLAAMLEERVPVETILLESDRDPLAPA